MRLTYQPTIDRFGSQEVDLPEVEVAYLENARHGVRLPEPSPPAPEDLARLKKDELVATAANLGVEVDPQARKDDLVAALAEAPAEVWANQPPSD